MIYIIAIIFPPIALLIRGRLGACLLNCLLCLLGYIPGIIHAIIVIANMDAEKRAQKIIDSK